MRYRLGFIGAGNMSGAIIKGLLNAGTAPDDLLICARTQATLDTYRALGCATTLDAGEVMRTCDAVMLGVKPQMLKDVLLPLAGDAGQHQPLILSVVAAIPATSIERWLGGNLAVIRTMPNTPSLVKQGATGLYANERVTDAQKALAETTFAGIGRFSWVNNEADLHAVTATAGSAPAYFFQFAESMQKTALELGLTDPQSRTLIGQTMLGAATMILETDTDIAQMRKNVCSPNGTTERAIQSFQKDDIDAVVRRAMLACLERSEELSSELGDA